MAEDSLPRRGFTRRGFLTVAVSAIVAGVVAGVGGYYAGTLAAPPVKEVIKEVTKTVERTVTTTLPGPPTTTTVTVTKTETVTVTPTPTLPKEPPIIRAWYVVPVENIISLFEVPYIMENVLKNYGKAYKLEFGRVASTPILINGLAARETDIGVLAYNSFAAAIIAGVVPGGMTAIAADFYDAHPDYYSFYWLTRIDSPINSVMDLKGKKLAVNGFGTGVHAGGVVTLKKYGLDPEKDVTFVEVPFPAMAVTVKDGKVDVGVFPTVYYYRAILEYPNAFKKVFDHYDAYGKPYLFTFLVASNEILKKSPDAVKALVEDYVLILRYIYTPANRAKVIESVAEHFKIPKDVLDAFYLLPGKDFYRRLDGRVVVDDLQFGITKLYEIGFITQNIDVAKYVDNSYLP